MLYALSVISLVFGSLALLYSTVIVIFRHIVYEANSLAESIYEFGLHLSFFVTVIGLIQTLPSDFYPVVATFSILISTILLYRTYNTFVYGRDYNHSVDISGKVYIVTGSNTGIGYETAKALVEMGGTVVMACRSTDKANAARKKILEATRCAITKVIVIPLDLCSFDSVRKFVDSFRALSLPLHCIINNAGIMMQERSLCKNGSKQLESVFLSNHLSHFLLNQLLIPDLEKTKHGRIVVLSSSLHRAIKRFDFENVNSEKHYSLFGTYAQSKLANLLYTFEQQKRLEASGSTVSVYAVHPGCVRTEVTRNMGLLMRIGNAIAAPFLMAMQKTPAQGAACSVYAATDPFLEGIGGDYLANCDTVEPSEGSLSAEDAEKLWDISMGLTGLSN